MTMTSASVRDRYELFANVWEGLAQAANDPTLYNHAIITNGAATFPAFDRLHRAIGDFNILVGQAKTRLRTEGGHDDVVDAYDRLMAAMQSTVETLNDELLFKAHEASCAATEEVI